MANIETTSYEIRSFSPTEPLALAEPPPPENHPPQRNRRERLYEVKKKYIAKLEANPYLGFDKKVYACYLRAKAIVALHDRNFREGYHYLFESAILGHEKATKHLLNTVRSEATMYKFEYYKRALSPEFAIAYLLKTWETHKCSEIAVVLSKYYAHVGNELERV